MHSCIGFLTLTCQIKKHHNRIQKKVIISGILQLSSQTYQLDKQKKTSIPCIKVFAQKLQKAARGSWLWHRSYVWLKPYYARGCVLGHQNNVQPLTLGCIFDFKLHRARRKVSLLFPALTTAHKVICFGSSLLTSPSPSNILTL